MISSLFGRFVVLCTLVSFSAAFAQVKSNHAPTMNGDQLFHGVKNQVMRFTLAGASDADRDELSYELVESQNFGELKNCLQGTNNLKCEFVPNPDFRGVASFTYKANDGVTDSQNSSKVVLRYDLNNHAPTVGIEREFSGTTNKTLTFTLPEGRDSDNDKIFYQLVSHNGAGTISGCFQNSESRVCEYHPVSGHNETVTILYKAFDGIASSEENGQITLRLGAVNHAPTMNGDQTFTTTKFTLAGASDEDGDSVTYRLVSPTSLPGLQGCLNGTSKLNCEYVPSKNERGEVVFTYRANDTKENSKNVATVRLKLGENTNASPLAQMSCEQKSRRLTCHSTSSDSDGTIAKTEWTLNGETIIGETFTRILPIDGSYKVNLRVMDNEGAESSIERSFSLFNTLPQINLSCLTNGSSVNCDAGLSYDPDGQIEKYEWDFGDGTSASGVNAAHTYLASGSYLVSLKAFDDMGDFSLATYQVQIAPNQVPEVKFTCTTKSRTITCSSQSSDADGTLTKEEWLVDHKIYEGVNLTHQVGEDGSYIVKLTVWDNAGAMISKEQTVVIQNALPEATISCKQETERTFHCQALNAHDPDGSITSFEWFADDQKVAETQSATISFGSSGQHNINLKITDDVGAFVKKSYPVSIEENEAPWSSLTYQASKGAGDVVFNVMKYDVEKELKTAIIEFGDGQSFELNIDTWMEQVTHVYEKIGQYNVKITLEDNVGNKSENMISVFAGDSSFVWPYLEVDAFQVAPLTLGAFAYFSYSPFYEVVEFSVDWGDGQSTTDSIPQYYRHNYQNPGDYTLTFTIKDASGRTNQKTQNYSVNSSAVDVSLPHPFPVYFKEGGFNSVFKFTSYSTSLSSLLTNASFELGDGNSQNFDLNESNQLVPSFYHVYAAGNYNSRLTVTDAEGNTNDQEVNLSAVAADVYTARIRCSNIGYDVTCTVKAFSPNGTLQGASVSWGDGATESLTDVSGTFYKKKITHHFESGGAKTVKLEITDSVNPIKTDKRTVNLPATITNPIAGFDCGQQGRKLYCGSTSSASNGELVEFVWEMSDGQTAYGPFLEHDFAQDGDYTVKLIVKDSLGLESQIEKTITISGNIAPTANMSCMVNVGSVNCDGGFSYDPDGYIVKYEWDMGDGTHYEGQNVNHSYQSAGQYTVTLTVTDNLGKQGVWAQTFQIAENQPPIISEFVCFNDSLDVHCNYAAYDTDGSVRSLNIDWGDGVTDNNYDHHYNASGTYTVKVTAIDDLNAITQQQKDVPVYGIPVANINCSINTLNVSCDSINSYSPNGMIIEARWDWGDNSQSTGDNVNHTYSTSGPYTITLTVKDSLGFEGRTIYNVNVLENHPPVIYAQNCTVSPQKINCAMGAIDYDSGDYVQRTYWIIDGIGEFEGSNFEYVFPNAGSYKVTAVAVDSFGVEERRTETYEVQMNQPPIAQVNCTAGQWSIQCWNESNDPEGQMQETYMVIDGERINENYTSKKFTEDRVVKVDVYATDSLGVTSSLSKYISIINMLPVVDFECSFPKVLTANCYFKSLYDPDEGIAKVEWEVDGTIVKTSTGEENIEQRFDVGGIHTVAVTVHDDAGGMTRKEIDIDVLIHRSPTGILLADQEIGAPPLAVKFEVSNPIAYDEAEIVSYDWKFTNGETGSGQTVSKTFDAVGKVTASVTIKDSLGYVTTLTKSVFVENVPQLKITTDKIEGKVPLTVAFSATETMASDSTVEKYDWSFGDGGAAEGETATHTFNYPGEYSVYLRAEDSLGAITATQTTITVQPNDISFYSPPPQIAISGQEYHYTPDVRTATDLVVSYFLEVAPEGMTINESTGEIKWISTDTIPSKHEVVIKAKSGEITEFQKFDIETYIPNTLGSYQILANAETVIEIENTKTVLDGMRIEVPEGAIERDMTVSLVRYRSLIKTDENQFGFSQKIKFLKPVLISPPNNSRDMISVLKFFSYSAAVLNKQKDSMYWKYIFPEIQGFRYIYKVSNFSLIFSFESTGYEMSKCAENDVFTDPDAEKYTKLLCAALSDLGISKLRFVIEKSLYENVFGRYDFDTEVIYFYPEEIERVNYVRLDGSDETLFKMFKTSLKHEWYHWLQFSVWGFDKKNGYEVDKNQPSVFNQTAQVAAHSVDSSLVTQMSKNVNVLMLLKNPLNRKDIEYGNYPFFSYIDSIDNFFIFWRDKMFSTDNFIEVLNLYLGGHLDSFYLDYIHRFLNLADNSLAKDFRKPINQTFGWTPFERGWTDRVKSGVLSQLSGTSWVINKDFFKWVSDLTNGFSINVDVPQGSILLNAYICSCATDGATINCSENQSSSVYYEQCTPILEQTRVNSGSEKLYTVPFNSLNDDLKEGKKHAIINVINPDSFIIDTQSQIFKASKYEITPQGNFISSLKLTRKNYDATDVALYKNTVATNVAVKFNAGLPQLIASKQDYTIRWFCNGRPCGEGNDAVHEFGSAGDYEIIGKIFGDGYLVGEGSAKIKVIPSTTYTLTVPKYKNVSYYNCPAKNAKCVQEGDISIQPYTKVYYSSSDLCKGRVQVIAMDNYGNHAMDVIEPASNTSERYPLGPIQIDSYSCVNRGCPYPWQDKSCGVYVDVYYTGLVDCGTGGGTYKICSKKACITGAVGTKLPEFYGEVFWNPDDPGEGFSIDVSYGEQSTSSSGGCQ